MKALWIPVAVSAALVVLTGGGVQATPGHGTLYGTDAAGAQLLEVNLGTGSGTPIASLGFSAPGLAVEPSTGTVFVGRGGGTPIIYTVDPDTGIVTTVGDTGLGFSAVSALDFHPDGMLYASVNIVGDGGTGGDHLAIIDTSNGSATVVGPYGVCAGSPCTLEGMEAIAFDTTGNLFGVSRSHNPIGTPGLYSIDVVTGEATFLHAIDDGTGTQPGGGIVSIQFNCAGQLFGGTRLGLLVSIDMGTGMTTTIGQATGGSALGGLGFAEPCGTPQVPASATWGVIILAALLLAGLAILLEVRRRHEPASSPS